MIQNYWDAGKEAQGGKFITVWIYLKKQEKSQVNNLTLYLKEIEKEKQTPKLKNKNTKIRVEINEMETKKLRKYQWFWKLVLWKNKIDKP